MRRFLLLTNCLIFIAICCFALSPLRLVCDSVRLFQMALPAANGGAYGVDQFPPFYPHLLCWLMRLDLCNSVVLYGINILSFGLGLLILHQIMRVNKCSDLESMLVLLTVQLSWCMAKHILYAMTDILLLPFFWGCVLMVMYFMEEEKWRRKMLFATLSVCLAVVAVTIRTAAIPLFGMIAICLAGISPARIREFLQRKTLVFRGGVVILLMFFGGMALLRFSGVSDKGGYFYWFKILIAQGGVSGFLRVLRWHVGEWAQLLVNFPIGRLPGWCALPSGLFAIGAIVCAATMCRKWLNWALAVTCVLYGFEIFLWPYTDARFFLPIYPLVMMSLVHLLYGYLSRGGLLRGVFGLYVGVFCLLGVLSWGWLACQWNFGVDFYKCTSVPALSKGYFYAFRYHIEDVPLEERNLPLFILKKFDPIHTMHEDGRLSLSDYQKYLRVSGEEDTDDEP